MRGFDEKGLVAGGLYVVLGAAASLGSLQYPIGNFWRMGAGFFPLMIGLALVATGIVVALIAVAPSAQPVRLERWPLRSLVLITAAVLAFAFLIRSGGIVLATAALVGIASFAAEDLKPLDALISLVVLVLLIWLIFISLLGLQLSLLPRGIGL